MALFFLTGLTGFTGYFFGFPDESQKSQSPSANKQIWVLMILVKRKYAVAIKKIEYFFPRQAGIGFHHFLLESDEK